jgi:hypothetical protein
MARLQRDAKREQHWRRHLIQQRSSGLTVRDYCQANGLRETAFLHWKKEIAKRDREAVSAAPHSAASAPAVAPTPAFVPVALIDSPAGRDETAIEVCLAGGHCVRVRSGCNLDLLADVLAMLRRSAREGRPC